MAKNDKIVCVENIPNVNSVSVEPLPQREYHVASLFFGMQTSNCGDIRRYWVCDAGNLD